MTVSLTLPRFARVSRTPLASRLMALVELHRQRRALAALDAHLLDDIGVSRTAARREAAKPVWDAPEHWTR